MSISVLFNVIDMEIISQSMYNTLYLYILNIIKLYELSYFFYNKLL